MQAVADGELDNVSELCDIKNNYLFNAYQNVKFRNLCWLTKIFFYWQSGVFLLNEGS